MNIKKLISTILKQVQDDVKNKRADSFHESALLFFTFIYSSSSENSGVPNIPSISSKIAEGFLA